MICNIIQKVIPFFFAYLENILRETCYSYIVCITITVIASKIDSGLITLPRCLEKVTMVTDSLQDLFKILKLHLLKYFHCKNTHIHKRQEKKKNNKKQKTKNLFPPPQNSKRTQFSLLVPCLCSKLSSLNYPDRAQTVFSSVL